MPATLKEKHIVADSKTIARAAYADLLERHPQWSIDELLLHPQSALKVCRATREKLGKRLEDHEILRCLLNGRKQGYLDGGN